MKNRIQREEYKNMTLDKAVDILKDYNNWRTYDGPLSLTPLKHSVKEITAAIDYVVNFIGGLRYESEFI